MREKVVQIGAGSASFTRGLAADMIHKGWDLDLVLVDVDATALSVAEGLVRKMIAMRDAPIRLTATLDRREALRDATAVICTVGVGGRRAWEKDVFVPRRYGIYHPVGDTVMPGGTSRALRMIPPMVAVARDVLDVCPTALFFNYGNPMAPVCRAVRKATGADMVGLCHGVFHVGQYLAKALGAEQTDFRYTALGMNHLTWFVEARVGGKDAMPRLQDIAAERAAQNAALQDGDGPPEDNPFSWELTRLFGAFPAVLDRHVTEFFPHLFAKEGSYYGKTLGVDVFPFENAISGGDQRFAAMSELASSDAPLPEGYLGQSSGEHEQVTAIIESIRQDLGEVYSANLPNRGQVPNLPADAVIECPAVADAGGMRPISQPPLSAGVVGTLATRLQWVEVVVEAALEGSRDKFVQALLMDGAVDSLDTAGRLANDLLDAQAEHLPQFARTGQ